MEIWESKPPGTLWATLGMLRNCFTCIFYLHCLLRWSGHVHRMEEKEFPKRVLYMSLGTTRLRGRPRNRWQDEVREDGRVVGGEG